MTEELINFADKALKTKISCSAISADGCCIENLIDQNQNNFLKPSHFMAEYYIKCPVEIVLTFPCLINISAIVVYPKVNSHRTRGFVLFTVFQKPSVEFPCTYNNDLSDSLCQKKNTYLLNQVGIYRESEKIKEKIVFKNKLHLKQFLSVDTDETREIRAHSSVHSCSNVIVKITWSTIPSIKKLEVWGTLANSNSPSVLSHFLKQLYDNYPINIDCRNDQPIKFSNDFNEEKQSLKLYDTSESIPAEFIDPITCSMMTIPMLLPSGNTVDSSTLDKFVVEEQKYGRLPSDPFTGIVFNGNRYPIPNCSLKARIDKYILKNSEFSREFNTCNTFDNKSNCDIINKRSNFSLKNDKLRLKRYCDDVFSNFTPEKRPKNSDISFNVGHHEEVLHDSLYSSLSAALSVLPSSFYKDTILICNICHVNDQACLLKLPCFHVCCRKCVIKMTLKLCNQCKKEFSWQEVNKLL